MKFDRARALSDALANIDVAVVGPLGPLAPFGPDAFGHGLQVHHRHFFNEAGRANTRIGPERVYTLLPMIGTQTGIQRTLVYVGASFVEKIKTVVADAGVRSDRIEAEASQVTAAHIRIVHTFIDIVAFLFSHKSVAVNTLAHIVA